MKGEKLPQICNFNNLECARLAMIYSVRKMEREELSLI